MPWLLHWKKAELQHMSDNVLPYTQLNETNITNTKTNVNSLIVLLEKEQGNIRFLINNMSHGSGTREFALAVQEVNMIEEVIQKWNALCEIYNNNTNTPQTKEAIISTVRKILELINFIVKGLYNLIWNT
jgi:hypothetical protein